MYMKSYIIRYIIVAFLLVVFLSQCSGPKKDEGITLRVFAYLDRTDKIASQSFDKVLAAFKEEYPEITLEFDYLVNEPYHNKLQAMNVSDQLPDLLTLWPGKRTGSLTENGKIKDLNPWLDAYKDKFHPSALAPQGPNGEIYELPEKITATHVMYTNTRLLKKLGLAYPKNLDELIAQGALIRKEGYIPIAMDNKDGWQMQSTLLSALLERTAGKAWLEDARLGKVSFSDKEFVDALNVIKTLYDTQMFSPGINQAEYGRALTDFVNEKAVYFVDGEWRISNLQHEGSDALKEAIAYNVFPRLPDEKG